MGGLFDMKRLFFVIGFFVLYYITCSYLFNSLSFHSYSFRQLYGIFDNSLNDILYFFQDNLAHIWLGNSELTINDYYEHILSICRGDDEGLLTTLFLSYLSTHDIYALYCVYTHILSYLFIGTMEMSDMVMSSSLQTLFDDLVLLLNSCPDNLEHVQVTYPFADNIIGTYLDEMVIYNSFY